MSNDNLTYKVVITFLDFVHVSQGYIHPEDNMLVKFVTYLTHLIVPLIVVGEQSCMVFFGALIITVLPGML